MAKKIHNLVLDLDVSPTLEGIVQVRGELNGLEQTLSGLQAHLAATFGKGVVMLGLWQCMAESSVLADTISDLSRAFGRLGNAITELVAPAVRSVLEFFTGLVTEAARFVEYVSEVLQVFLGTDKALQAATQSQKKLTAATKETAKAAQRSLMGFDQLNRLQKKSASTGAKPADTTQKTEKLPTEKDLDIYQTLGLSVIRDLAADLGSINWGPTIQYLGYLYTALEPYQPMLFDGLKFFWDEILFPLTKWTIEEALPKFLKLLNVALQSLTVIIGVAQPGLEWLWNNFLLPIGQWAGEKLLAALDWLITALADISNWVLDNEDLFWWIVGIVGMLALGIGSCNDALGSFLGIGQQGNLIIGQMGSTMNVADLSVAALLLSIAALASAIVLLVENWDEIKAVAAEAWQGVKKVWEGATTWFRVNVLNPLQNAFRGSINGILGLINGILQGITLGINTIIQSLNALSFTVPDWVPLLGGKTFGFQLKTVKAPQIPYLAKGAVLPANQPFLAMVGDQRHGTNVEAPLATIQEAVAAVMEDSARANLAGQEAMVELLSQILTAVLGIRIGDEVIARAAQRYGRKQAVMKGGAF